jgi:hypothetical protein
VEAKELSVIAHGKTLCAIFRAHATEEAVFKPKELERLYDDRR